MSSNFFITKIIAGSAGFVGIGTVAALGLSGNIFNVQKPLSNIESKSEIIYVIAKTAATVSPKVALKNGEENNFQCKLELTNPIYSKNCVVKSITFPTTGNDFTKKQISLNDLNLYVGQEVSSSDEITTDKYFQISVSSELLKGLKGDLNKVIKLVNKTAPTTEYASLNPLFSVGNSVHVGKTQFVVGQVSEIYSVTQNQEDSVVSGGTLSNVSGKTFKCQFNDPSQEKDSCTIHSLTNNNSSPGPLSDLSFVDNTANANLPTSIVKNNYYIFKLSEANGKNISSFVKNGDVFVEVAANGQSTVQNKLKITNIIPAIIVGESSSKYLIKLN